MTRRQLRLAADPRTGFAFASDLLWRFGSPCPETAPSRCGEIASPVAVTWPVVLQHPNATPFVRPIEAGLAAIGTVRRAEIPQPYAGIVLFEADVGDGPRRVAVDYFDFTYVDARCAAEVDIYFKMQHLRGGYPGVGNVVPGGYVTSSQFLYRHWCRLRELHRTARLRVDVFGRLGLRFSPELRRRAIAMLESDPRITFAGGRRATRHTWYLREMARARLCLDLPGQGPFCYRLVECLAMGCCVIGPRHAAVLAVDLRPGVEIVHCADDLSDLVDLCVEYSRDAEARTAVGHAAARYFDQHLHPVRLAEYYVETVRRATAGA